MEDLNKLLVYCHENIGKYFIKNKIHTFYDDECNFAFDIECCPTNESKEESENKENNYNSQKASGMVTVPASSTAKPTWKLNPTWFRSNSARG